MKLNYNADFPHKSRTDYLWKVCIFIGILNSMIETSDLLTESDIVAFVTLVIWLNIHKVI